MNILLQTFLDNVLTIKILRCYFYHNEIRLIFVDAMIVAIVQSSISVAYFYCLSSFDYGFYSPVVAFVSHFISHLNVKDRSGNEMVC